MIAIGSIVSGYRVERVLGAGGMGTVYLAQNPELPRRDALKVLSAELSYDPAFRLRFVREADVAASLQHPNIVSIYSRGESDERQLWIAMQFVDGTDADGALRAGTMTPARAVHIIGEVARAVDYANDHNVVHRDIKPANFLLSGDGDSPERVLLGDFGIARGIDDFGLTLTGSIISTMAYSAPEVLAGSAFDRRADHYSLACSLFRLLTGHTPFAAASANGPAAVMMAHLHSPPPRVSDRIPGLPIALDAVIAKALAKNPADRFDSATLFASAAAAVLHLQCAPDVLLRAVPSDNVDAKPALAESNWWRPSNGTRTGYAMQALPTQMRPAPAASPLPTPRHPAHGGRWVVPVMTAIGLLVAGTITAVVWGGGKDHAPAKTLAAQTTPSVTPPPPPAVQPSGLEGLLLPVDQIRALMGGMNPKTIDIDTLWDLSNEISDTDCVGPYEAGQRAVYGKYLFTGYQLHILVDQPQPLNTVTQSVVGFPDAEQADGAVNDQVRQWDQCANRTFTYHHDDASQSVTLGAPTTDPSGAHVISVHYQYGQQQHCEHALTARQNVVVDVSACSVKPGNQAVSILGQIADRISHP
jgi:eukaryotic-like serine/threonine-protein kinase